MMHDEVFGARKLDLKCQGENPPQFSFPQDKGGRRNTTYKKLREKTARREYAQTSHYTSEFRRDVSDNPSRNRGIQRRRWQSEPGVPFGQERRGKRIEGEGDGSAGSHHVTSTFGLSCRRRLLQMRAYVDVQDRAIRLPQGRSRLRVMPLSGAVCQQSAAPYPTG